jgi:hypothetical protein
VTTDPLAPLVPAAAKRGRPQARDVARDALDRWQLVAPRPATRRNRETFAAEAATSVLAALTSAGFLVVHQDALSADVLAAVAGHQDSP